MYLDTVFFFKAVTGRVEINPTVIPQIRAPTRTTKYTINPDILYFSSETVKRHPFKDRLLTELVEYGMLLPQTLDYCSFSSFKALLYGYYEQALMLLLTTLMTLPSLNLYA